ncbi:DEAD/DEAH box helicase [Aeropyrum camini]|uniref:DNA repair helicase n=1 Tax=Aeropyrum camini SY1 = JCM 12091 TaxID=1198449 RepID=U3TFT4_9CREN|nr:DEAD/DEAH box helicase [Aeropyrum camini]BAN90164.1 DNA repair helicase [Aeropyrum camini SY1 = JCM 12091]
MERGLEPWSLTFRVKGWLGDEAFKEVSRFARYLGRDRGYGLFRIDPVRLRENGLSLWDAIASLEDLGVVVEEDLEALRRAAEEALRVVMELRGGWIYIRSRVMLKPILEEEGLSLPYDRGERAYRAPPLLYPRLREAFEGRGLKVEDRVFPPSSHRLPRPIRFTGKLRDYQEEALQAWRKARGRGVIVLPTGAGKTVVAIAAVAEAGVWSLIVVYTRDHVRQWIEAFRRFTDAHGLVGAYYGEEKRLAPITVTTYQTAYRHIDRLAPLFPLLVFDEAHHIPAEKFKRIASASPAPYRMGLSATIEREDGRHEEVYSLVGGVVYSSSPGELTRKGYLAPFIIRRVKVELEGEEKRVYEDLKRKYRLLARGRSFEKILEDARRGDPTAVEAIRVNTRMKEIVQLSESKIRAVEKLVREELSRGSKIIVFTQYRRQAEEIARRTGALLLHGGLERRLREATLAKFRAMESGVLVVTTVGDEGLDIPDANVGILVSGTGSRRQFIQRLGRLLRPGEGKRAVLYEVIAKGTGEELQSRRRRGRG